MSGQATGIPVGLTRVATLDGLVKQMRSGETIIMNSIILAMACTCAPLVPQAPSCQGMHVTCKRASEHARAPRTRCPP